MAETLVKQPWSDSQLRELPVDFLTDSLVPVMVSANGTKGTCPLSEEVCASLFPVLALLVIFHSSPYCSSKELAMYLT